jgi:GNAT superfamily N-acetyltransferase
VIRVITDDWNGVVCSDLDETTADAIIAREIEYFAELGREWEWKLYSYDTPADLTDRLLAAGFVAEPQETLLVAPVAALDVKAAPPDGVELSPVEDPRGVDAVVRVHEAVFGEVDTPLRERLLAEIQAGTVSAVVAYADGRPICSGRIEFHAGTAFASLWGGGTLPGYRGRGVFRAVVAHRAALASARGCRYLQTDASADSRPILERLGFRVLGTTTPFIHP